MPVLHRAAFGHASPEAVLGPVARAVVRSGIPAAAILLPVAFFFSVLTPDATQPNGLIHLAYAGAAILAVALLTLGIGLLRRKAGNRERARRARCYMGP